MFCFSFCNSGKEEVAKPSGFTSIVDDNNEKIVVETTNDSTLSFPHLKNLNQPIEPVDDDETSISEESLFEPIVEELESVVEPTEPFVPVEKQEEDLVPFDEPSSCAPTEKAVSPSPSPEPIVNHLEEENIQITKDEFIAVLQRIEKENEWHQKRQAKKATSSKKKSRRNKKKNNKESKSSMGTQEFKKARTMNVPADASRPAADRVPLTSRN